MWATKRVDLREFPRRHSNMFPLWQLPTIALPLRFELDVVKTKADLIRFKDRRVVAIGRYQSHTRQAPDRAGIIGFKGNYITANIVLEDDTEIPIYPTYLKQSLRSPDEVKAFEGKIVKAIGLIQTETAPSSESRIAFIGLDGIWHYQANF
jgi:hypothetical protein